MHQVLSEMGLVLAPAVQLPMMAPPMQLPGAPFAPAMQLPLDAMQAPMQAPMQPRRLAEQAAAAEPGGFADDESVRARAAIHASFAGMGAPYTQYSYPGGTPLYMKDYMETIATHPARF